MLCRDVDIEPIILRILRYIFEDKEIKIYNYETNKSEGQLATRKEVAMFRKCRMINRFTSGLKEDFEVVEIDFKVYCKIVK